MASQVFIRTASKRDLAAIRQLLIETWHATYEPIIGADKVDEITAIWHSPEALESRLSAPNSEFLVADTGSEITAMAFASQDGKVIDLQQLYVSPAHQGSGIGTKLIRELLSCFIGAETMRVQVASANTGAVGFYTAFDFASDGSDPVREEATGMDHVTLLLDIPEQHRWNAL
ncbi:GNAT family N-acetyltransferase [Salaquimonas pukyongi]|uniref:GNAT family N-acetyltransferase n=1 Tax=Salaquimonas pukyongi TaxID=2712698 RepID=UPI00096BBABD|nr:GNAT family N-acetyltransferase [Salaquimonas pukyongi]